MMHYRNNTVRLYTILLLGLLSTPLGARQLIPRLRLPDSLTIGDLFHLSLTVIAPPQSRVIAPETQNFGQAVVKEWHTRTRESSLADTVEFNYVLSTYIPGICTIPPLQVFVITEDKTDTLRSDTLEIPLYSVIPHESIDSALDIKDLRSPFRVGRPSRWWLWSVVALLLLAAAAYAGYRFMQKRKTKPRTVPLPPPYEEAMHALRELELRSLIAQGLVREHVFRLSDILKRYIERRFNINAQEFTTEEIVLWLRTSALPREVRRHVEQFFADSDPVKYAKWLPANSALVAMTAQVRTFVEESRPAAEPQPAPPGPSPDASADTTQQECSHGV